LVQGTARTPSLRVHQFGLTMAGIAHSSWQACQTKSIRSHNPLQGPPRLAQRVPLLDVEQSEGTAVASMKHSDEAMTCLWKVWNNLRRHRWSMDGPFLDLLVEKHLIGKRTARFYRGSQGWDCVPALLTSILSTLMYINPPHAMTSAYGLKSVHAFSPGFCFYFLGVSFLWYVRLRVINSDELREAITKCSDDIRIDGPLAISGSKRWDSRAACRGSIVRSFGGLLFLGVLWRTWDPSVYGVALVVSAGLTHMLHARAASPSPIGIAIAVSYDKVYTLRNKIKAWSNKSTDERRRDELFWLRMLDEYRSMSDGLEKVWSAAAPYLFVVVAMNFASCLFAFIAVMSADCLAHAWVLGLLNVFSALTMLKQIRELAGVATQCMSISEIKDSIFRAACVAHCDESGRSMMTQNQRLDNHAFLEFMKGNPAGVRIMGKLVDFNVVVRCAGLTFTSFTWVLSHHIMR